MAFTRLQERARELVQHQRLQKEILRTLVILLFFLLTTGGMVVGQMVSDHLFDRYVRKVNITDSDILFSRAWQGTGQSASGEPESYAMKPLRDIVFQVLPDWSAKRGWLPDALLSPLVIGCFLVNVVWRRQKILRYQGWIVLRRYLVILTLLYIFRTITFIVTTVPSPMDDCRPMYVRVGKDDDKEDTLHQYLILFGRMASGKVTACTDNIYSGHTTLITVSLWCYIQYSGAIALKIYALLHGCVALLAILMCRLHYTVDVIVAMIIASFVYVTVHYLIQFAMDELYIKENPAPLEHVETEKLLLKRLSWHGILRAMSWVDGMDLRMVKPECT